MAFPPYQHTQGFDDASVQFYQGRRPFAMMKRSMSEKREHELMTNMGAGDEEASDSECHAGERKKRLSAEQVKALEKSFEQGSKLEPERKMKLARLLGLQPRQIAIWFQNRRARWKTKQLERDYDALKRQLDSLKADNQHLHSSNQKLRAQLMALKARESCEVNDQSGDVNLHTHSFMPSNSDTSREMNPVLQEESFGNMFTNGGAWPWPDQLSNFSMNQSHIASQ